MKCIHTYICTYIYTHTYIIMNIYIHTHIIQSDEHVVPRENGQMDQRTNGHSEPFMFLHSKRQFKYYTDDNILIKSLFQNRFYINISYLLTNTQNFTLFLLNLSLILCKDTLFVTLNSALFRCRLTALMYDLKCLTLYINKSQNNHFQMRRNVMVVIDIYSLFNGFLFAYKE